MAVFHNLPSEGVKREIFEQINRLRQKHTFDLYSINNLEDAFWDLRPCTRQHHFVPFQALPLFHSPLGRLNQLIRRPDLASLRRRDGSLCTGDPHKNPRYKNMQKLAGDQPNFIWRVPDSHEQVGEVLSTVDVVVVLSRCVENDPGTIAEAFAAKTPVIGSDTCGVVEHIHHDVNGLIFKRGDTKDLAHQLHRIIEEPDLLTRLRSNIKTPKNIEENVVELIQIYKNLTRTSRNQTSAFSQNSCFLCKNLTAKVLIQ